MTSRRDAIRTMTATAAAGLLPAAAGAAGPAQTGTGPLDARAFGLPGDTANPAGWGRLVDHVGKTGRTVYLPQGIYRITALTLPSAGTFTADAGAVFAREGLSSAPMFSVPADYTGAQSARALVLNGLTIDAGTGGRRVGTGLFIANNASLALEGITVRNAAIGIDIVGGQFLSLYRIKLQENDIGLHCRPNRDEGGSNSLTLVHPIFVNNAVGLFLDNEDNVYSQGDILLLNPQFLTNNHCAIAVMGKNARLRTQLYITGFAPEGNGQALNGTEPRRQVKGRAIPRCSLYSRFGNICISDSGIAEYGTTNPCFIIEQSTLSLHNVEGYGGPGGVSVVADAGSDVVISGCYGLIGTCHGVTTFSGHLVPWASQGALAGPIRRRSAPHIANHFADPVVGNFGAVTTVVTSVVTEATGKAQRATFAPRIGSSEDNALRLSIPRGPTERLFVRLELKSDRDCRLRIATYPNDGALGVWLRKDEPTLVCYWVNDAPNPAGLVAFSPADEQGATVTFRNVQVIRGSLGDPQFRADCDTLCAGGFNPLGHGTA